jgi:hypothetical protein
MADRWVFAGLWEAFKWPNGDVTRSYPRHIDGSQRAGGPDPYPYPIHIHNRIPVVLEAEDWPIWLGGQPGDLLALLHAPVADVLHCQLIRRKGRRADNRRGCGPVGDQGVGKEPSPDRAVALCFPA